MWGSVERRSWTLSARKTLARTSRATAARHATGRLRRLRKPAAFKALHEYCPLPGLMEEPT